VSEPQLPAGETERHPLPRNLLHDLRTPLNHIIGYSALLIEQEQDRGELTAELQKIEAAGKQLLSLIEEKFDSVAVAQTSGTTDARRIDGKAAETLPDADSPAAQGVVLVVDDIDANRDVLSRLLQRQGYAVVIAESGQAALDQLHASNIDLVLLDIMMPEMDGYEVLQRLKADPRCTTFQSS
jgi:PleD family two-component response regulator